MYNHNWRQKQMTNVTAQFGAAKVVRPFINFENKYSNNIGTDIPIAIPGTLDSNAGKSGFDDNLLGGIPVSLGSKLTIFLPLLNYDASLDPEVFEDSSDIIPVPYQYTFVWRLRNIVDYTRSLTRDPSIQPFHLGSESRGANNQFVIPACVNSVGIASSATLDFKEDRGSGSSTGILTQKSVTKIVKDVLTVEGGLSEFKSGLNLTKKEFFAPISPNTPDNEAEQDLIFGAYQQGVGENISNETVNYLAFETFAKGDDLMILVQREPFLKPANNIVSSEWDFEFVDRQFSDVFGTNDGNRPKPNDNSGIYLIQGVN